MFYIVPNDGYTISRHNLSIVTYGSTYEDQYYNGQWWESDSNVGLVSISLNCGMCPYPQDDGTYKANKYEQAQVEIGGQNYNYSDYFDPFGPGVGTLFPTIRLVDVLGPWPNNPEPDYYFEFVDGITPDWYCPSDWTDNVVIFQPVYLSSMIPGSNPQDMVFKINGSAMLDDGSECGEFNADIDEE